MRSAIATVTWSDWAAAMAWSMSFQASCAPVGRPNDSSIAIRVASSAAAAAISNAWPILAGLNTTFRSMGCRRSRSNPASFHPDVNAATGASDSTGARTTPALTAKGSTADAGTVESTDTAAGSEAGSDEPQPATKEATSSTPAKRYMTFGRSATSSSSTQTSNHTRHGHRRPRRSLAPARHGVAPTRSWAPTHTAPPRELSGAFAAASRATPVQARSETRPSAAKAPIHQVLRGGDDGNRTHDPLLAKQTPR